MTFKHIRIILLLLIMAYIGADTYLNNKRATDWKWPIRIVVYPINADGSETSEKHIKQLKNTHFDNINDVLVSQSKRYGRDLTEPLDIQLAPQLHAIPPKIPAKRSGLAIFWWSLKLRYWAWSTDNYKGPKPQIKAYALYFSPETNPSLKHSTGLKKAKLSLNYLFASTEQTEQNKVVVLHEILHTLGATDKYDLRNGYPFFPEGFANSQQKPLFPQSKAEIMGGRIAISNTEATIPNDLNTLVIGPKTAKEIGWID